MYRYGMKVPEVDLQKALESRHKFHDNLGVGEHMVGRHVVFIEVRMERACHRERLN